MTQRLDPATVTRLHGRCQWVRKSAPFLHPPVIAQWCERPRLFEDPTGPWLLVPAEQDPLRTLKGEVIIPARPRADLERVLASGAEFDRIAIAHELNPQGPVAQIRKTFAATPVTCDPQAAKALVGDIPVPHKTSTTARRLDKALRIPGAVVAAGAGAGAGALVADAGRDPIVFGVIGCDGTPLDGQACAWFPLAAWLW